MSLSVGKNAVDFFLDRTDRLTLRFFGGEPLLEFKLMKKIVLYSRAAASRKNKNIDYVIVTNGTLLVRDVAEFCSENQIDYSLSLDGVQQAHDANRVFVSGKGSFKAVEKNIPHMLELNPDLLIVPVVSPNNVAMLSTSIAFLLEKGFRNISFSPNYSHPDFREYLPIMRKEYFKLADMYLDYLRKGERLFFSIFYPQDALPNRGRCSPGQKAFSVDPLGDIYPCCTFVDVQAYPIGNIACGIDLEKNDVFQRDFNLLERHLEEEHHDCPKNSFCKQGCGCTNLITTGELSKTDPVICEAGRMEAEVRDYVNLRSG